MTPNRSLHFLCLHTGLCDLARPLRTQERTRHGALHRTLFGEQGLTHVAKPADEEHENHVCLQGSLPHARPPQASCPSSPAEREPVLSVRTSPHKTNAPAPRHLPVIEHFHSGPAATTSRKQNRPRKKPTLQRFSPGCQTVPPSPYTMYRR